MKIGLLGCLINNGNLGCVALTYSLLYLLEEIGNEKDEKYEYDVFESKPNAQKTKYAADRLGIEENRIFSYDITPMFRMRRFIHHFSTGIKTLSAMKECDVFIDMTGGDSFTDIYGQYTFDSETNVKYLVKRLGKKLILGPQTYGPFESEKNKTKAKKIIELADLVISRDQKSADFLSTFVNKEVYVTTDVAFALPYKKVELPDNGKIKVGINVSGLLIKEKTEGTTLNVELKTDYEQYIKELINWLLDQGKYEIYIIPHVENDGNEWVRSIFGDKLTYFEPFNDPIEAKGVIAAMDIFIGSRMHATIGAFSAGVATIPVAYSRKFSGLFENISYCNVVDICNENMNDTLEKSINYIKSYYNLFKSEFHDNLSSKINMNKKLVEREISNE